VHCRTAATSGRQHAHLIVPAAKVAGLAATCAAFDCLSGPSWLISTLQREPRPVLRCSGGSARLIPPPTPHHTPPHRLTPSPANRPLTLSLMFLPLALLCSTVAFLVQQPLPGVRRRSGQPPQRHAGAAAVQPALPQRQHRVCVRCTCHHRACCVTALGCKWLPCREFWGRRWNRVAGSKFRSTVYEPICGGIALQAAGGAMHQARGPPQRVPAWRRIAAMCATFAASGLVHELAFFHLTRRVSGAWAAAQLHAHSCALSKQAAACVCAGCALADDCITAQC
jgi:hypothetical protein